MSGDNPRFGAGMGTVTMYAPGPIDAPYPENPWIPPGSPFTPGIQPIPAGLAQPPFTQATGGPEPIEQIIARAKARDGVLRELLGALECQVTNIKHELALLEKVLNAVEEKP